MMINSPRRYIWFGLIVVAVGISACNRPEAEPLLRPLDPWAFRSVLDRQPRMLTLALDSSCYVAYDLSRATLYKAWRGGVLMEGAPYTDKKNVQPTSWGAAYWSDSLRQSRWVVEAQGHSQLTRVMYRGYALENNRLALHYALALSSGDTVRVTERPEFVQSPDGQPQLERQFHTEGVPAGTILALRLPDTTFVLPTNATDHWVMYFEPLPPPPPPVRQPSFDHRGRYWIEKSDCLTCHELYEPNVGPSFQQIAQRYTPHEAVITQLAQKVQRGGSGNWGTAVMNAHPSLDDRVVRTMLDYIFTLKPDDEKDTSLVPNEIRVSPVSANPPTQPGFGTALAGVHPSYNLTTLHSTNFQPKVGGLAFLPDGRLLVTTWDVVGGVYIVDGLADGDNVSVKRIASGLAEPLGIEVVDGEIFVLQKQELTHLIDHDGDEVIDEYRVVCDAWEVTDDFHEFSFGLVYHDNHFYATLSMAMRLIGDEQQKFDRGRTIKISHDGSYTWVNYGLRTPNGIGVGVDQELFVTDNQGEWLPANKLIHVAPGRYHGMAWGILGSMAEPRVAPPAVWLPGDEIGNSPSEPVLIHDGPYQGQMLHGDVTHGGIKRDFLEKINGEYQGAVFRFTQGLAAGVNRLCWGPDRALYIGEVGMTGGWSWQGKQFGLQRLRYNGQSTFEMLAVRAQPQGFEIELTEPLAKEVSWQAEDFVVRQWWYQPTPAYGGPKMDPEELQITRLDVSENRTRLYLAIPGLKEEHVVYLRLPDQMRSSSGQPLWSSESWYTLNNIPQ